MLGKLPVGPAAKAAIRPSSTQVSVLKPAIMDHGSVEGSWSSRSRTTCTLCARLPEKSAGPRSRSPRTSPPAADLALVRVEEDARLARALVVPDGPPTPWLAPCASERSVGFSGRAFPGSCPLRLESTAAERSSDYYSALLPGLNYRTGTKCFQNQATTSGVIGI